MVKTLFLGALLVILGFTCNYAVRKVNDGYMPTAASQAHRDYYSPFDTKHLSIQGNHLELVALSDVIPIGLLYYSIGDLIEVFGLVLLFISGTFLAWQWDKEFGWLKNK